MEKVNIHAAKTHFSKLIQRVQDGEEIVIAKSGTPVARLVPAGPGAKRRVPGSARGMFTMSDDFDDPLPDEIMKYFE